MHLKQVHLLLQLHVERSKPWPATCEHVNMSAVDNHGGMCLSVMISGLHQHGFDPVAIIPSCCQFHVYTAMACDVSAQH
jgi:hypothetical protein